MEDLIALVDLDGTLADYNEALERDLEAIRSPHEPVIDYDREYGKKTPYMKERIRIIRSQPGWWLNLKPIQKGFDILEELKKFGFTFHVLTKAPHSVPTAWTEKVQWCQEHLPNVDITISQDKSLVYGKILVDDWPPYADAWLEHRPRGLLIMPAQRWNEGYSHPNCVRYDGTNMAEVIERVQALIDKLK